MLVQPGPAAPPPPAGAAPAPGAARPVDPPLSAEHLRAIALARWEARKINRAATVAAISGWTMACFACISILGGLFSLKELFVGLGLAAVAWGELRGSKRLRLLDPEAPRRLGFNQILLGVVLLLYGSWGLIQALTAPSPFEHYLAGGGQAAEILEPIDQLNRAVNVIVYAAFLCAGVAAASFGSLYYFTRRRHMVRYLQKTPKWVVETIRAATGARPPRPPGETGTLRSRSGPKHE